MDVTVNKVVIHELIKEQHRDPLPLNPMKKVIPSKNEVVVKLVAGILELYGKRNNSAQYGVFKKGPTAGSFPREFDSYYKLKLPSEKEFLEISEVALGELYRLAKSNPASSGGYILIADIESEGGRFLLVAMLKKKDGIRLNQYLIPEELEQIDINSIHQAAKLNIQKYGLFVNAGDEEKDEMNYLSFVTPSSNKAATGYFVEALGCSKGTASSKATDTLIRESVAFFRDKPELKESRFDFKDELIRYLHDCVDNGRSVKLSEVDLIARKYFPGSEIEETDAFSEALYTKLNSEINSVPKEFPANSLVLKRHTHIKYKSDSWQILFDKDLLGVTADSEIQYVVDRTGKANDSLVLSNLPADFRQKIIDELRDKGIEV